MALAVGNWASGREDRTREVQYLEQLVEELEYDSNILGNALIPSAERGLAALERVDSVVSGAARLPSDTTSLLLDVLAGRGAQTVRLGTRATFDELLATGSLRLIESASLRSAIVNYYASKDLAERRVEGAKTAYAEVVQRYIPTAPSGGLVSTRPEGAQEELLRSTDRRRAAQVLEVPDVAEVITGQKNYLRLAVPILESVLAQGGELTAAVEGELLRLR